MDPLIGKKLGQYEIISKIGAGGMATVYRARQTSVDRDVAVKVIRSDLISDEQFSERFRREARTIASLSHLHILKVFDYGQQGDMAYLVMELLEGGSLSRLIRNDGALTPARAARMLEQVSAALDHAHQLGIVHRDLKPDNVLLDRSGNAFLTDFGIAKLLNETTSITRTGMVMGTPAYMAPELWSGDTADGRADVYALGVILFEMLTGSAPFGGDTPFRIMHMHIYEPLPSASKVNPTLPNGVDQVLARALAKSKEDRFNRAGEMADAFRAVLGGSIPASLTAPVASRSKPPDFDPSLTSPVPATQAGMQRPPASRPKMPDPADATMLQGSQGKAPARRGGLLIAGLMVILLLVGGGIVLGMMASNNASLASTQTANALDLGSTAAALAATQSAVPTRTLTPSATSTPSLTLTPSASLPPTLDETATKAAAELAITNAASTLSAQSTALSAIFMRATQTVEASVRLQTQAASETAAAEMALHATSTVQALLRERLATNAAVQYITSTAKAFATDTAANARFQSATGTAVAQLGMTATTQKIMRDQLATNAAGSFATSTAAALHIAGTLGAQQTLIAALETTATARGRTLILQQVTLTVLARTQQAAEAVGTVLAQQTNVAGLQATALAQLQKTALAQQPTPTPTSILTTDAGCPGFMPSRLKIGEQARITPGDPNRLRDSPGSGTVIETIPAGGVILVLDGPRCTVTRQGTGVAWWYVQYGVFVGWTAEGNNTDYWIEPFSGFSGTWVKGTCPTSPVSRLSIGNVGRVTLSGSANRLNSRPARPSVDSESYTLSLIEPGARFMVLAGPVCNHNITWWQVRYQGVIGWTGESDNSTYWAEPWN